MEDLVQLENQASWNIAAILLPLSCIEDQLADSFENHPGVKNFEYEMVEMPNYRPRFVETDLIGNQKQEKV